MATAKDKEFARIGILLGFIEQSKFSHYWLQYEKQIIYKQHLTFAQWLVQNKFLSLAQVAAVEHQIINSHDVNSEIDTEINSILENEYPESLDLGAKNLNAGNFSDIPKTTAGTLFDDSQDKNKLNIPQTFVDEASPIAYGSSIPNTIYHSENIPQVQDNFGEFPFDNKEKMFPDTKVQGAPSTVINVSEAFGSNDSLSGDLTNKKIQPGKKFGRYDIINEIGRGGMGKVYKVYDPESKKVVALKVLLAAEERENEKMGRFLREAFLSSKFDHPNIVTVHDIGNEEGQIFFTMDFIEGDTLDKLLKQNQLTRRQIVDIMIKVSNAVAHAHGKKIIHRDLKPENIIIDSNNEPKVMDFGLAKIINEDSKLSKSGMIIGTVHYMAPEQADGLVKELDERSDTYALGAILYELLTGRPPYEGSTFSQVIDQILYKDPTPPSKIKKRIPKNLEKICLKAIEKEKEDRYQTANELARDLVLFSKNQPVNIKSPFWPKVLRRIKLNLRSRRARRNLILGCLFVLCVLLSTFVLINKNVKSSAMFRDEEVKFSLVNKQNLTKLVFSPEEDILLHIKWPDTKKLSQKDVKLEWYGEKIAAFQSKYKENLPVNEIITNVQLDKNPGNYKLNLKFVVESFEKEVSLNFQITKKYLFREDLQRTGNTEEAFTLKDKSIYWEDQVPGGNFSTPVVIGDIIYVCCLDGYVRILDIKSKTIKEIFRAKNKHSDPEKSAIVSSPAVEGEYLYFGSRNHSFYAINKNSGLEIWRFETLGSIDSSPLLVNDKCYFGSKDQFFYCLNRYNGKEIWSFATKNEIVSSPSYYNDIIFFGSKDHYLYALNAQTGSQIWKYKSQASITSTPAVYGEHVYFSSNDGFVYAVEIKTGKIKWTSKCSELDYTSIAVTNKYVFCASYDGLNVIDINNGKKVKFFPSKKRIYSSPIFTQDMNLYYTSDEGALYTVNTVSMTRKGVRIGNKNEYRSSPVISNNMMLLFALRGNFTVIK